MKLLIESKMTNILIFYNYLRLFNDGLIAKINFLLKSIKTRKVGNRQKKVNEL
jgi:hypothetical protein